MDSMKRVATGIVVACWILFIGYMCGCHITEPNFDNFLPYTFATIFGALAWIQPWRFA